MLSVMNQFNCKCLHCTPYGVAESLESTYLLQDYASMLSKNEPHLLVDVRLPVELDICRLPNPDIISILFVIYNVFPAYSFPKVFGIDACIL